MELKAHKKYYIFRFILDSLTVLAAWWLTFFIRFVLMAGTTSHLHYFLVYSPLVLFIHLYYIDMHNMMDREIIEDWAQEFSTLIKICIKSFFAIVLFFYFVNYGIFSRLSLLFFLFFSLFFLTIERIFIDNFYANRRKKGKSVRKVFLVGNDSKLLEYAEMLKTYPEKGLNPCAWYDSAGNTLKGVESVNGNLIEQIDRYKADIVLVGYAHEQTAEMKKALLECYDLLIPVVVFAGLPYSFLNTQMDSEYHLFYFNSFMMSFTNRIVKRFIDIVGALTGLILGLPIFLLFPIIIKGGSKGPVFYGQKRMTRDGKIFTMWKFRSMVMDAEHKTGAVWAKKEDHRITPFGKFIRSTSLDEFPQFWNVLRGQMSLVGPRPERPELIETFRKEIPGYMLRHKMKGGITGWAQVNGFRGNTSLERRIEFDLYYINKWSHLMDLKILFLTFIKGFINENAY